MSTTHDDQPRDAQEIDTAHGARVLAAIVLLATVIALSLLPVIVPAADDDTATATESGIATAPVLIGA